MIRLRHILQKLAPAALIGLGLLATRPASAQVVEVDLRGAVFHEPSPTSAMTVYTPGATLTVNPWEFLSVFATYEADIVTGASEAIKAGPITPDIISEATSLDDTRNVFGGGFTMRRKNTTLTAAYTNGKEEDYKSQAITVTATTEFLQRNTEISMSYGRGFDQVCNQAYPASRDPTARIPLDSSAGCFKDETTRQAIDVDVDTFGMGWSQSWTPVFMTQLVFTGGLQHGFLGNPYRGVVIAASGQAAQENHPENRARFAVGLRAKYYVRDLEMAFGGGVRGYRDTWDILSQTFELEAERYIFPWMRLFVHARYYNQTKALFWSDDYTGGEPEFGPRGQYWSGDREVSPLRSYLLGGRILMSWKGAPGNRILGALLDANFGANLDIVKTDLRDFTLAGREPDDTTSFLLGVSLHGGF
jgi:hypothetical protein